MDAHGSLLGDDGFDSKLQRLSVAGHAHGKWDATYEMCFPGERTECLCIRIGAFGTYDLIIANELPGGGMAGDDGIGEGIPPE